LCFFFFLFFPSDELDDDEELDDDDDESSSLPSHPSALTVSSTKATDEDKSSLHFLAFTVVAFSSERFFSSLVSTMATL
jgi:hypothetical protein